MASAVGIANRALQKVGTSKRIQALGDDSTEAKAVNNCYLDLLRAELSINVWGFATTRAELAALTTTPLFLRLFEYRLPNGYLRKAPLDPKQREFTNDYIIEDGKILSDNPGPLQIRFVRHNSQESLYPAVFTEALASRIAIEIVGELSQDKDLKNNLQNEYKFWISQARSQNAIEQGSSKQAADPWETVRRSTVT